MENQFIIKIFVYIIIIILIFLIVKKIDPNYAINPKRVICPKCKTKQPIFKLPKNQTQLMWGGHTCPNCGTEMDKFGNIIK